MVLPDTTPLSAPRRTALMREPHLAEAIAWLPFATGAAAVTSIALVWVKTLRTAVFSHAPFITVCALSAVAMSLVAGWMLRRLARSFPWMTDSDFASWLLAVDAGVLCLVFAVALATKGSPADEVTGWIWPLLNKRWLVALYNIAIATFLVFPVAVSRFCNAAPVGASTAASAAAPSLGRRDWRLTIGGLLAVVALCWYVAGPPWHLDRHHRSIEWHEQVHFGSLHAMAKGYPPAAGPAATAYGPGSQALMYGVMKIAGTFDLVSFRSAWALQQFLAVLIVGAVAYWWLGLGSAAAVIVLSLTYSPLAFYYTVDGGVFTGFFGWANPLRYVATLIVIPALAVAATRGVGPLAIVPLGAVWALGAWFAQDSLTTTAVGAVLFLALLWLTGTISFVRGCQLLGALVAGFVCVVVLMLVYYARHGVAAEVVRTYFLFPRALFAGLGNTWWPANEYGRPDRWSYYLTLPFLIVCGLCALWRLPALRLAAPLDRRRTLFCAFICVQLVCYQSVLFSSDTSHLMSTMIALPFLLVLGVVELPMWMVATLRAQWIVRVGFIAIAMIVYPMALPSASFSALRRPASRFLSEAAAPSVGAGPKSTPLARTRPLLRNEPLFLGELQTTVGEFEAFANDVHAIVGGRNTYIVRVGWIAGGLIAFVADLAPAPHPPAGDLLTLNDDVRMQVAAHMRDNPNAYGAFIGPSLDDPEARAFLDVHPGAARIEKKLGAATVHILLSST